MASGTSISVEPRAKALRFTTASGRRYLSVTLDDGRVLALPLSLYPSLARATPSQRGRWEMLGKGAGIHWPALDLDLSVRGMLFGTPEHSSTRKPRRRAG